MNSIETYRKKMASCDCMLEDHHLLNTLFLNLIIFVKIKDVNVIPKNQK